MSLSLFVRKWLLGLFALLSATHAFPAPNVQSYSGEFNISGPQPGSQDYPHLSIGPYGGYIVWQDNTASQGLTINALPLDAQLSRIGNPFRVNQAKTGDHESPKVALLKDGGAVFVWRGGRFGFQHIYARFLSSSNTWLTGDVLVGSFNRNFQINPDVATLANGNVVMVWASYNQLSAVSMQDVYAQVFSPNGVKINSEILVNQFGIFNQRSPAVGALPNGGFVVAWVSEQQRSGSTDMQFLVLNANTNGDNGVQFSPFARASVDIYARAYDGSASPVSDEFLVNSDNNICANPSVATGADNSFVVSWSQKNPDNRQAGWDVYSRRFSSSRVAEVVQRVNTYVYGDQFAPQASSIQSGYLVIWTSMRQDGSWEGVYGQFLSPEGALSGGEFRINSTTVSRQFHPALGADPSGRFLAVWSSFVGGGKDFDLNAQAYASGDFVAVDAGSSNRYGAPLVDSGGGGGNNGSAGGGGGDTGSGSTNKLDFPETPPGGIASTGMPPSKASYNGLFFDRSRIAPSSSGFFTVKTTDSKGAFSASVIVSGVKYGFSGRFDSAGVFSAALARTSLTVKLQLDGSNNQIRGTVSDGHWTAELLADQVVFNKVSRPASQAGNYTIVIPGDSQDTGCPGGAGFGTVKVGVDGTIQMAATLADGTKVTQSSALSKNGIWPLFVSSASGRGELISWVQFANASSSDLSGPLVWVKPAMAASRYYARGFTNSITAIGSAYRAPAPGTRALSITSGQLVLSGGGLAAPLTNSVTLGLNNTAASTSGARLAITPASGSFKGTVVHPQTGKSVLFQGTVFKKANVGVGYFLGTDQSGEVFLSPAP